MTQDNGTTGRIAGLDPRGAGNERKRLMDRLEMDATEENYPWDAGSIPFWAVALWVTLWLAGVAMIAGLGWLGWMAGRLIAGVL